MKVIVVACLILNTESCKTFEVTVPSIKTEEECLEAIMTKAKQYPNWRVKSKLCIKL